MREARIGGHWTRESHELNKQCDCNILILLYKISTKINGTKVKLKWEFISIGLMIL